MTIASRLFGILAKLPPATSYDVIVERDLPVPMPDGVTLFADRYIPPRGATHPPTILVRSCYGRGSIFGLLYGQLFAERGFQVVIQSTRGTADSGGELDPFGTEHADGLATLAWLRRQPWFSGQLATNGASYLGFVQWAMASEAGPELRAMALQVTASEFRNQTYAGESFTLDTALTWTQLMYHLKHTRNLRKGPDSSQLQPLYSYLPLRDLDMLATNHEAPFYQEWLTHTEPGDPYWRERSFDDTVHDVAVPINMVGGWYDIFLPWMLRDYLALRAAGHQPFLTIGPWGHSSLRLFAASLRESLTWFQAHLLGKRSLLRTAPVRIFVTGSNQWLDLADWPPPHQAVRHLYLQPSARLSLDFPAPSEPDHYRYDPADPTPAVAGPHLSGQSGPTDNRQLEARSDVLTYTSAHLEHDVTIIGSVQAETLRAFESRQYRFLCASLRRLSAGFFT